MAKKFIVRLHSAEKAYLKEISSTGKTNAYRIRHANILLAVAVNGGTMNDHEAVKAFGCHLRTVENIRQRFVEQGFETALERKPREFPPRERLLDGDGEAQLIALACSEAPEGRSSWTLHLLADKLVELQIVVSISHETVRQVLNKNELKPHLRRCWVIPPDKNAEFVANMEDVLEVYKRPYDPKYPVICMDEQPTQLIKETRQKIAAKPGQSERFDYEYERNGTAAIFMFTEPLAGKRVVNVRKRRTAIDWAREIKKLVDNTYAKADKIILVCDNLNTHKPASFYKAFPPAKARRLLNRLEIHYTPKHGSWLNIAEIELSALTRQCINRRIPEFDLLKHQVKVWCKERNKKQKTISWQFSTKDARIKLKRLYPQI
jgi:transposase